jgi:3-deoxy-manno-octulosonate cytidylyltransferase (CMP-KDO synthetase)
MSYRIVIPARFSATRLPGKALLQLAGKPMIQWVYERACRARATEVLIATDDARIAAAARSFGAEVAMTAATHVSGTDRIAEVARARHWGDGEIVVNVQGDEPLMPPELIDQAAALLAQHAKADIATLSTPVDSAAAMLDPNVVKLVTDREQRALYFSRAPIPWHRDDAAAGGAGGLAPQRNFVGARRHIGIYAYRVAALLALTALPPSALELIEKLEQLRALENGMDIRVADSCVPPGPDVNTHEDAARVAALLASG